MPDFVPTVDMKLFSSKEDQTTFTLTGHTVKRPYLAIFDRKVPVVNGNGTSVPWYRIRIIRGVLDSAGDPIQTRVTCDVTIRWPLEALSADAIADIAKLGSLLSNVDLQSDIVDEQLLPR